MRNSILLAFAALLLMVLAGSIFNLSSAYAEGLDTGGPQKGSGDVARLMATPGTYVVRTIWKDAPLTKARVEWRRKIEDSAPTLVGDTLRVGTANFRPETGSYFLTADWRADGDYTRPRRPGDRFAWFGGNPLFVSSESSETFTLMLEEVPAPPVTAQTGTGVYGRVTLDGVPVADAGIYAYAKTGSGFKGDDFLGHTHANAQGEFKLELPPDQYYILARLRPADNSVNIGPLHKGDLLGYNPGNPIVVEQGRLAIAAIPLVQLKMVKTRAEASAMLPGIIEGRIVDSNGKPVAGVYAALYSGQNMSGRSMFRSEPTGNDGRFKLSVPLPGNYYLSARSGYGTPVAGSWFGAWAGNNEHKIAVKFGDMRGDIEIVVGRLTK